MFDSFKPFMQLEHQQFDFLPSRYEVWIGGKMVKSGYSSAKVSARVDKSPINNEDYTLITVNNPEIFSELATTNGFDLFMTATDRLQLVTIPANGNNTECIGISMFKQIIGSTRRTKSFLKNEPYCCNLFFLNGAINKVTFSFNEPEKLIEFYQ